MAYRFADKRNGRRQRSGRLSMLLLFAMPVLLLLLLWPVNAWFYHEARSTQDIATDAAALAAVQALVDDRRLLGPESTIELIDEARKYAQLYAELNPSAGQKLTVKPNRDHDPEGDIVFGAWVADRLKTQKNWQDPLFLPTIDAVQITIRRTRKRGNAVHPIGEAFLSFHSVDIVTKATAFFDRRVNGFHPVGKQNIPLAPIALSADAVSTLMGSSENFAIFRDEWMYDRQQKMFLRGPDGIGEIRATFGGVPAMDDRTRQAEVNAVVLQIGGRNHNGLETVCRQLLEGITEQDLADRGGKLELDGQGKLVLPGSHFFAQTEGLRNCLESLESINQPLDAPRIFPIYAGTDNGLPIIRDFVAARVVWVAPAGDGPGITFILQPTVLSSATALTVQNRPINHFLGRVRLVD